MRHINFEAQQTSGQDPDVEKLWHEEAERRYAQYLRGEVEAIPGDEVMAEARKRLK